MTKETLAYENIDREFKELYVSDIKKTVVAFANTEGGILYIGINDAGEVVGLPNVDDVMQQTANTLKDSIAPDVMPFVKIRAVTKDGKQIIEVAVQNGTSRPYYIREKGLKPSGVYIRQGSSNQQLSDEGIRRMLIEVNGKSYEGMRSMQQELTFTALRKHFRQRELKLDEAQLRTLKLIGDDGLYTNLALLLALILIPVSELYLKGGNPTSEYAGENAIEAPFIFHKDGWYYLFVSWDYCCRGEKSTYRVAVGRSRKITGPYLDRNGKDMSIGGGTPFFGGDGVSLQAAGHCAAYSFPDGDIFICHGYSVAHDGAAMLVQRKISWTDDGWPTVEP